MIIPYIYITLITSPAWLNFSPSGLLLPVYFLYRRLRLKFTPLFHFNVICMKKHFLLLFLAGITANPIIAQNLILNPGCDDTLVAGKIPSWTEITGNKWTQRSENPSPYAGTSYFYAGAVSVGELGQIIDISSDSIGIDLGIKYYYFTGYVRAYSQSPADESDIYIRFTDHSGNLLADHILGPYRQTATWLRIDTVFTAPPLSRKIDLRLHAVRYNGSNNDGYFDELYLGETPLVGIPEITRPRDFLIYPNPTQGQLTIKTSPAAGSSLTSICDLGGRQLILVRMTASETVIDISTLPRGVYVVKVWNERGVFAEKLIKQ